MALGLLGFFFFCWGGGGGRESGFPVRPCSLGGHGTLAGRIKRPGWVGEEASKKFYEGRLLLEIQTLTFLFTIFYQER